MAPVSDPYRLLGIARGATADQIKAAHRALAKRFSMAIESREVKLERRARRLLLDPGGRKARTCGDHRRARDHDRRIGDPGDRGSVGLEEPHARQVVGA